MSNALERSLARLEAVESASAAITAEANFSRTTKQQAQAAISERSHELFDLAHDVAVTAVNANVRTDIHAYVMTRVADGFLQRNGLYPKKIVPVLFNRGWVLDKVPGFTAPPVMSYTTMYLATNGGIYHRPKEQSGSELKSDRPPVEITADYRPTTLHEPNEVAANNHLDRIELYLGNFIKTHALVDFLSE